MKEFVLCELVKDGVIYGAYAWDNGLTLTENLIEVERARADINRFDGVFCELNFVY